MPKNKKVSENLKRYPQKKFWEKPDGGGVTSTRKSSPASLRRNVCANLHQISWWEKARQHSSAGQAVTLFQQQRQLAMPLSMLLMTSISISKINLKDRSFTHLTLRKFKTQGNGITTRNANFWRVFHDLICKSSSLGNSNRKRKNKRN